MSRTSRSGGSKRSLRLRRRSCSTLTRKSQAGILGNGQPPGGRRLTRSKLTVKLPALFADYWQCMTHIHLVLHGTVWSPGRHYDSKPGIFAGLSVVIPYRSVAALLAHAIVGRAAAAAGPSGSCIEQSIRVSTPWSGR